MIDPTLLIMGMLCGLVGFGFFSYGKKQRALVPFLIGIAFFLIPYLISDHSTLMIVSLVLLIIPFVIRSPDL